MAINKYSITPIETGRTTEGQREISIGCFLLQNDEKTVLVDLGPAGFTLKGDISAEDITDVIYTHLHYNHRGPDTAFEMFPNAVFHLPKTGLSEEPANGGDASFAGFIEKAKAECGRINFADEAVVAPGLRIIYLGGHSACSRGIRVNTERGAFIIAGDEITSYDDFAAAVCNVINAGSNKIGATNDMLADLALNGEVIVPSHDPIVYKTAQENWFEDIKKLSIKSAEGYRTHKPRVIGCACEGGCC